MDNRSNETFDYLEKEVRILDSLIQEIRIFSENEILKISISLMTRDKIIKILFEDITEYSFYHNHNYIFYNVEDYKFFRLQDEFYISFDPDQKVNGLSDRDGDFIKAGRISLLP